MSIQRWSNRPHPYLAATNADGDLQLWGADDGAFVTYADHVAEVEAMRAACIAAVEGAVYVPLSNSGWFLISRNTKLWDQRETWTRHGWLKYRDSAVAALREVS